MSDDVADVDVEALKAQHLNQALAFVEEALGQPRQDAIEARAQARFDALLEAHRQWASTEGPTFTLAILNARTAREQQEAVHNAMQGAFLAGAMAMQEGGK